MDKEPTVCVPISYLNSNMDLRDWFAGQALMGLIGRNWDIENKGDDAVMEQWAESAYITADLMIKAREIKNDTE